MENIDKIKEKTNKTIETLTRELEGLNDDQLHDFFMFFYKLNHQHYYMVEMDLFESFLQAFDSNPFKVNKDKNFKKELIENIIKYSYDHMSLITAAVLIKRKFTIEEIIENYYSNINVYDNNLF